MRWLLFQFLHLVSTKRAIPLAFHRTTQSYTLKMEPLHRTLFVTHHRFGSCDLHPSCCRSQSCLQKIPACKCNKWVHWDQSAFQIQVPSRQFCEPHQYAHIACYTYRFIAILPLGVVCVDFSGWGMLEVKPSFFIWLP